jgi:bifunctional enzyme CysN/CysC
MADGETPPSGLMDIAPTQRSLLRFLTCGSVDDGKSTLIGRLLYDAGLIPDDSSSRSNATASRHGTTGEALDFALLVDGLEASGSRHHHRRRLPLLRTPRRSFIVADTPGHEQYTRNMATGAVDLRPRRVCWSTPQGLLTQTRRHSFICSLLGIRHVVLAVNKFDLVGFDRAVFERIEAEYRAFAADLGLRRSPAVPLSARGGDNVWLRSSHTPWYHGPTLIEHLETVDIETALEDAPLRFPVQWVNRPDQSFRGFAGTLTAGVVRPGDPVVVASSGRETTVARIVTADGDLSEARAGDAVTLTLADEVDIARGDLLATTHARPETADAVFADLIWLSDTPLDLARPYWMKLGPRRVLAHVDALEHRTDVNTLKPEAAESLSGGEVGLARVRTGAPIAFDPFQSDRTTGAFILIDRESNATVAAGMIRRAAREATNVHRHAASVDRKGREGQNGHHGAALWFTGLSGSGKSTVADWVERRLHARGVRTYMLDGDNLRHGLNADLSFSERDRAENVRRAGEVAKLFVDAGVVVLCSFISPYRSERERVRAAFGKGDFFEIMWMRRWRRAWRGTPRDCTPRRWPARSRTSRAWTRRTSPRSRPRSFCRPRSRPLRVGGRGDSVAQPLRRPRLGAPDRPGRFRRRRAVIASRFGLVHFGASQTRPSLRERYAHA